MLSLSPLSIYILRAYSLSYILCLYSLSLTHAHTHTRTFFLFRCTESITILYTPEGYIQCFVDSMILYYFLLLIWTKKALYSILQPLPCLLWRMRDSMVSHGLHGTIQQACLSGATMLDISMHIRARKFSSLPDMICLDSQPWISIVQYFIKNEGITNRRTMIKESW